MFESVLQIHVDVCIRMLVVHVWHMNMCWHAPTHTCVWPCAEACTHSCCVLAWGHSVFVIAYVCMHMNTCVCTDRQCPQALAKHGVSIPLLIFSKTIFILLLLWLPSSSVANTFFFSFFLLPLPPPFSFPTFFFSPPPGAPPLLLPFLSPKFSDFLITRTKGNVHMYKGTRIKSQCWIALLRIPDLSFSIKAA